MRSLPYITMPCADPIFTDLAQNKRGAAVIPIFTPSTKPNRQLKGERASRNEQSATLSFAAKRKQQSRILQRRSPSVNAATPSAQQPKSAAYMNRYIQVRHGAGLSRGPIGGNSRREREIKHAGRELKAVPAIMYFLCGRGIHIWLPNSALLAIFSPHRFPGNFLAARRGDWSVCVCVCVCTYLLVSIKAAAAEKVWIREKERGVFLLSYRRSQEACYNFKCRAREKVCSLFVIRQIICRVGFCPRVLWRIDVNEMGVMDGQMLARMQYKVDVQMLLGTSVQEIVQRRAAMHGVLNHVSAKYLLWL